jgi:hypothetical protein
MLAYEGPSRHFLGHRDRVQAEFDALNQEEVEKAFSRIAIPFAHVVTYVSDFCGKSSTDPLFDAAALMLSAVDLLVSAFQMARQRAGRESFILIRVALETSCVAYTLAAEPKCFDDYCAARFDSTRAITYGKRLVPEIGRVYGELSRLAVHISRFTYGPKNSVDREGKFTESFGLGCSRESAFDDKLPLAGVCLVASITAHLAQAVFFNADEAVNRAKSKGGRFVLLNAAASAQWIQDDLNVFWARLSRSSTGEGKTTAGNG